MDADFRSSFLTLATYNFKTMLTWIKNVAVSYAINTILKQPLANSVSRLSNETEHCATLFLNTVSKATVLSCGERVLQNLYIVHLNEINRNVRIYIL